MSSEMVQAIRKMAFPFHKKETKDRLIEKMEGKAYVLLGESSHGTSEFYTIRAELSQRLIQEQGFRFIAVEGDWPSCYALNRYVKGCAGAASSAREALKDFDRWPSWMWANEEILAFAEWLREYNTGKPPEAKAGFYGMDVYSLWESMSDILAYLSKKNGADLQAAKKAFECFEPHDRNEQAYGISASLYGEGCEDEVIALLSRLRDQWKDAGPAADEREDAFSAELNAMAVKGAEAYYRTMIRHDAESWNVRDRHMVDVLEKLTAFHGEGARGIVWAHNTHVGDARYTDMAEDGMVNIGQLLHEKLGEKVYAVGFGTYQGSVIAGKEWGAPQKIMQAPAAMPGSWEDLLHQAGAEDKLLLFDKEASILDEAPLGHRAIGVVYHPAWERGNYVPTTLTKRYDAFIYIGRTEALHPLKQERVFV